MNSGRRPDHWKAIQFNDEVVVRRALIMSCLAISFLILQSRSSTFADSLPRELWNIYDTIIYAHMTLHHAQRGQLRDKETQILRLVILLCVIEWDLLQWNNWQIACEEKASDHLKGHCIVFLFVFWNFHARSSFQSLSHLLPLSSLLSSTHLLTSPATVAAHRQTSHRMNTSMRR